MREPRVYSREFRLQVVQRILDGERVPALSQELGIHRKLLYEWWRRVNEGGEAGLRDRGRPRKIEAAVGIRSKQRTIAELERTVNHQALAIQFLQKCAAANREMARQMTSDWRDAVFQSIEETLRDRCGLSVETMCELAQVARSTYYRYVRARDPQAVEDGNQNTA